MTVTRKRIPSFTTTVDADVDIDPDELHEAGWHHEFECDTIAEASDQVGNQLRAARAAALAVVASLHRQAHPGQSREVRLCHEEPCRSLSIEQLREVSR